MTNALVLKPRIDKSFKKADCYSSHDKYACIAFMWVMQQKVVVCTSLEMLVYSAMFRNCIKPSALFHEVQIQSAFFFVGQIANDIVELLPFVTLFLMKFSAVFGVSVAAVMNYCVMSQLGIYVQIRTL